MYLETISENKRIKLRYFKILIKNENGRIVFFPQIHYDIVILTTNKTITKHNTALNCSRI